MALEYKFDEHAETWPYFMLAMLVVGLLPLTVTWLTGVIWPSDAVSSSKDVKGAINHDHKTLALPPAATIDGLDSRRKSDRIFNKKLLILVIGWATVAYIWIIYAKEVSLQGLFDPHTILDIPYNADDKTVRATYRRLSLKFHPDKIKKDVSEKEKEEMEAAFIKINLAYKALTDEVTKNNLKLYGHPDGPQQVIPGVALPKFLVEGKYSPIMIVVYFLLIGVILPYVVGSWWSNVKSHTKKGLRVDTATLFTRKLADKNPGKVFTPYDILDWILQSDEITSQNLNLSAEEIKKLVLEYLSRDFSGAYEVQKFKIVSQLPMLINSFIEIATVFRAPDVIQAAYELEKALLQASSPVGKHKELLQLPYVDKEVVEAQPVKKLGKLVTLSDEEASKVLGIQDPKKLKAALDIGKHIPLVRILDASFRVPGEDIVPPNAMAHLVVKFFIKSPVLKSCATVEENRFLEEETIEDLKNPLRANGDAPLLPLAYAPYFPLQMANYWSVFVINQRDNKLVEGSEILHMDRVDLSNLTLKQEEWIRGEQGTVVLSTFKVKLNVPTPPNVGNYHFRLLMKNNAYFGNDVDIPLEMTVTNPPVNISAVKKAVGDVESDSDSDSDISDPEEDSLAGALAALRGGAVKKTTTDEGEESDNESVFTDINTDTEDEGGN